MMMKPSCSCDPWHEASTLYQCDQSRVSKHVGVMYAAQPASTHMCECPPVVYNCLQDHGLAPSVAIIGSASVQQAGEWYVGSVQDPKTLEDSQCKPCHHHLGVMDMKDGVYQHVLEGIAHLQDSLPNSGLAQAKQVAHIPKAGRCGQLA